jgi:hypothetical protein
MPWVIPHKTFRFVSSISKALALDYGRVTESFVRDLVFTLMTLGFFLVAIGYLRGCERLK